MNDLTVTVRESRAPHDRLRLSLVIAILCGCAARGRLEPADDAPSLCGPTSWTAAAAEGEPLVQQNERFAMAQRGPIHQKLQFFVGEWIRVGEGGSPGDPAHCIQFVGRHGVWLRWESTMRPPPANGGAISGFAMLGSNGRDDVVKRVYVDEQSTAVVIQEGGWTTDTTLELTGELQWGDDTYHMKNVFEIAGPDTFTWKHYQSINEPNNYRLRSTGRFKRRT